MKKCNAYIILICLMLSLYGCSQGEAAEETNSSMAETEIVVEKKDSQIVGNSEEENETDELSEEPDEELTGELVYDMSKDSLMSNIGDSCFMEPMLQNPTDNGVTVQWFTEDAGDSNCLYLYESLENSENNIAPKTYQASTYKLSRIRGGKSNKDKDKAKLECDIYKHVVFVDDLPVYHGFASERRFYKVATDDLTSNTYSLSAKASEGTPMRILLTSDHQVKDMVAANIQKVYETVGNIDAILMNGDLVDVTDRAYDWFYKDNAFFKCLTGTAQSKINGVNYYGAPLIQQAPMYTSVGNHDVMGVYDNNTSLSTQFNEPRPRSQAESKWELADLKDDISREEFIINNSFNTVTTEEMFENPASALGGEKYYAVTIGDIRLIVLDVSRVWRLPNIGLGGKYSEIPGCSSFDYAGGDFIFESIKEGSDQIEFLDEELSKDEFKNAKIKMVMFHSEAHSLGGNQSPAFTDPVAKEVVSPITGQNMIIYDYPIEDDYIKNVIEPRLVGSGTNLLFEAHSHLWNRFVTPSGMNILESSNVGNSYGAFDASDKIRGSYPTAFNRNDKYHNLADEWDKNNYPEFGDPYGLNPVKPNICNLPDEKPYLDSNTITAFSILDTYKGTVDSYYFDTEKPESDVVMFDSFKLY